MICVSESYRCQLSEVIRKVKAIVTLVLSGKSDHTGFAERRSLFCAHRGARRPDAQMENLTSIEKPNLGVFKDRNLLYVKF